METAGEIARIRRNRYIIPKEADLFTGVIQVHASGAAHVINEQAGAKDLYISGENTWTAMHGDRVVARIITEPHPRESRPGRPSDRHEGRVIRILERANDTIVGTLQKSKNFHYVVADDPRFVNNLYVPAPESALGARPGDKVVARVEDWQSRHVNPEGRVIEVLGRAGAPGIDILSIIKKNRLPTRFPDEVSAEAEEIPAEVPEGEAARREDLRNRFIITIDPDDARDFDDAIEVQRTTHGWHVGIHIADVAHYVRPKSALDREGRSRGNSVYLADRVIPMLPEALSNGICSLKPDVDRLAFSVFADISSSGKVHNVRFARTVIRSVARLTYKQAFAILQNPPYDEISTRVHVAWELASLLRKNRFAAGSLDLDFPELKVWLDENGAPIKLEKVENDISHQLIEEMMLLANEFVARELKRARQPTIYRIHEKPDPDKLAEYREVAATHGVKAGDLTHRPALQKLLADIRGEPHEYALKLGLLKSLKRARYATDPLGHYGLAKNDYLHFTSPIRRYADLVAHRALARHIGLTKHSPASTDLASVAEHISNTERVATDAERESTKLKKLEFFQRQIADRRGSIFNAVIIDVRNFGFFVELPDFLLTGLVHVSSLDDDFYVHDPGRARFVGRKSKRLFQAGQAIQVTVARVDTFKQQVDFRPVSA
jgi:ribonuclease R